MKRTFGILFGTAAVAACASTGGNMKKENGRGEEKQNAVTLLKSIETGDAAAVAVINPSKYIQHNPMVGDGLAGFGELMKQLPPGSAKVSTVRAFQDGDFVFTHTEYNFFGPKIGFDLFRFEDGKIVEHWDNLQEWRDKPNPSGRTMTDGSTTVRDLDKTEANKALIAAFVNEVLVQGQMDKVRNFFAGDSYLQHNPMVADGVSGLGAALAEMAKQGIAMKFDRVHKILGEGNFVLTVAEGSFGGKPTSFYDLYRVEGGKIAEHWDVIETLLPSDQHKNKNGKFGGL